MALPNRKPGESLDDFVLRLAGALSVVHRRMDGMSATLAGHSDDIGNLREEQGQIRARQDAINDSFSDLRVDLSGTELRIVRAIQQQQHETLRAAFQAIADAVKTRAVGAALVIVAVALAMRLVGVTPSALTTSWGSAEFAKPAHYETPRETKRRVQPDTD